MRTTYILKLSVTCIPLLFSILSVLGQNGFQSSLKIRPLNHSQTITALADGGLLISSTIEDSSSVYEGYNLTRLDYNGSIIWSNNYNSLNQYDLCYYPVELNNGDIIISGTGEAMILTKFYSNGSIKWSKTIKPTGNRSVYGYGRVLETKNKGLIVSGFIGLDILRGDNYVIQLDSVGNLIWAKRYGGLGYEDNSRLSKTKDGGFILTSGTQNSFNTQFKDYLVIKLDSVGNVEWSKTYGGYHNDDPWSAEQMSDNGFLISGRSYSTGSSTLLLIKTDSIGNVEWAKNYQNNQGLSAMIASDKSIILSVTFNDSLGFPSVGMIKTDSLGNVIWGKRYGNATYGSELDLSLNSSYLIAGVSTAYNELLIVKTDTSGNTGCPQQNISVNYSSMPLTGNNVVLLTDTVTTTITSRQSTSTPAQTIYAQCSSTIEIHEILDSQRGSALVYPNPTSGFLVIDESLESISNVEIINSVGQKMSVLRFQNNTLNVSALPAGLYIIIVENEGETYRCQFIKR